MEKHECIFFFWLNLRQAPASAECPRHLVNPSIFLDWTHIRFSSSSIGMRLLCTSVERVVGLTGHRCAWLRFGPHVSPTIQSSKHSRISICLSSCSVLLPPLSRPSSLLSFLRSSSPFFCLVSLLNPRPPSTLIYTESSYSVNQLRRVLTIWYVINGRIILMQSLRRQQGAMNLVTLGTL